MVRDRHHLGRLLAGVDDLFVIGGDIEDPVGEYASAVELLLVVVDHRRRPEIGIAAHPENHPHISLPELEQALRDKSRLAGYLVTQMCFDLETRAPGSCASVSKAWSSRSSSGCPAGWPAASCSSCRRAPASGRRSTSCASRRACAGCSRAA